MKSLSVPHTWDGPFYSVLLWTWTPIHMSHSGRSEHLFIAYLFLHSFSFGLYKREVIKKKKKRAFIHFLSPPMFGLFLGRAESVSGSA